MAGITSGSYIPIAVSSASSTVKNGEIRFKMAYWFNPTNIGDAVSVQDSNSNVIWEGRCEVANQSQVITFPREICVNGYKVPTLDSGVLYLYYV